MDEDLHQRIADLAHEEHRLRLAHGADGLSPQERQRMQDIEVALDRAWDLLRQREARRSAGLDPAGAQERPADIVEGYVQ